MKKLLLLLFLAVPLLGEEAPAPPAQPSPNGAARRTHLFQIVLVRGAVGGAEETVGVPKSAEKAIRDLRDFLPFRSYKMLDSGLLRIQESDSGKIRVDGIPPQQYDVLVAARPGANGKISIWAFTVTAARTPRATPLPAGVAPEAERPIIDTSFAIDVGETVVVGSSKLGGDQALIVLFTALPNH
jgi:hypothetical protein